MSAHLEDADNYVQALVKAYKKTNLKSYSLKPKGIWKIFVTTQ